MTKKPAAKSAMMSLRLTDAQKKFLAECEARTGNDASSIIRLLIHDAMTWGLPGDRREPVIAAAEVGQQSDQRALEDAERARLARKEAERKEAERQATIARKRAELEALERGEDPDAIDAPQSAIYDDPDADSSTGEFDESQLADDPPVSDGGVQAAPATVRGPAFSVTRPAGFGADLRGGNQMGDARGNVLRDNFKFMGR